MDTIIILSRGSRDMRYREFNLFPQGYIVSKWLSVVVLVTILFYYTLKQLSHQVILNNYAFGESFW